MFFGWLVPPRPRKVGTDFVKKLISVHSGCVLHRTVSMESSIQLCHSEAKSFSAV